MSIQTPDWVKQAVFYQIFPDRFARGKEIKNQRGITFKPWGSPPEEQGYQGGDLWGIVDKLDYLQELGITALYLNPIFSSASNHRYHTYDFFEIDPLLGGKEALRTLLDEAHKRNMYVVLDAVFNHASRGFWAFHHILENGADSPYIDWFTIHDWPLRAYHSDGENPPNYAAWWGLPALPKLNVSNPGVRDHLLEVARYWIDFGIDGWRLDVPEEINDVDFWQAFRTVVKEGNPDAYIVGEIWHEAADWLHGDRFDAVMNYVFSRAALGFFGRETLRTDYKPGGYTLEKLTDADFAATVDHMNRCHDWAVTTAQLNLMDSHDTARTLWTVDGAEDAARLCLLFQMTMPGAPCIYYGDEVGMTGANDPYCRGAFPWHDESQWQTDLLDFHRRAIAMRHRYPVLQTGTFHTLYADQGFYIFRRDLGEQSAIVIFNINQEDVVRSVDLQQTSPDGAVYQSIWNQGDHGPYTVERGWLSDMHIPERGAVVLVSQPELSGKS